VGESPNLVNWLNPDVASTTYDFDEDANSNMVEAMHEAAYDKIGRGYARTRRADPRIAALISASLQSARSVVNVGAGVGSYEPDDMEVIAVEPSREMIAQRAPGSGRVIVAGAEEIPLPDDAADAAMTILSIHHWQDPQAGVEEMRRVARSRVVIMTYDPSELGWWLRDYAPEIFADDVRRFPSIEDILGWLGGGSVEVMEVPADCTDLFLGALWARPELILDDDVRSSTSGFARLDDEREQKTVAQLRADLESGRWDELHADLRERPALDVGLRLITA
jgi:SAM-dependent methyltransferase